MTYTVKAGDTLFGIANKFGVDVQYLKAVNSLNSNVLMIGQVLVIPDGERPQDASPQGFAYTVKAGDTLFGLAARFGTSAIAIRLLNGLASDMLSIGQQLLMPGSGQPTSGGGEPAWGGETFTYEVEPGDYLSAIARKFGTTVSRIKSLNNLRSDSLHIGQLLKIPGTQPEGGNGGGNPQTGGSTAYVVKAGDTLSKIAQSHGTTVSEIKRLNGLNSDNLFIGQMLTLPAAGTSGGGGATSGGSEQPKPDVAQTHVVRTGDSLWRISQQYGVSVDELRRWNKLSTDSLSVGQVLVVGFSDAGGGGGDGGGSTGQPDAVGLPPLRFDYGFEISGSVGEEGLNEVGDLKKVQKRLLDIGLLDELPYRTEVPGEDDTGNVNPVRIIQTVNAIKEFQRDYMRLTGGEVTGTILPDSVTLMYLNTSPVPGKVDLAEAKTALREVTVALTDGAELRQDSISAPVGATNWGNKPLDVRKIQQRLREMKYTVPQSEEPSGMSAISQNLIPKTIAALFRFQQIVEYFINHRAEILGSTKTYVRKVVSPDDYTMLLLKSYKQYELVMAHPLNPSNSLKVELNNFVRSAATVDVEGVSYVGEVSPYDVPLEVYRGFGLTDSQARALRYISGHEGKFDAINTYDMALLSYGFIQFAGNDKGTLGAFLATTKMNYPFTFERRFARYGLDVEYAVSNGIVKRAQLVLAKPDGGGVLRGPEAERHIKGDLRYIGAFIRAAYDPNVQKAQIETAARGYVYPALNHTLTFDVQVGGSKVSVNKLPFYRLVRSEMGVTALIDITVNQWTDNAEEYFVEAFKALAKKDGLNTTAKLLAADEKKLLGEIVSYTQSIGQYPISQRVANIAASGELSAWKV